MKYDSLSRNTVKITLSEEDMREYSLCAESIAMRTAETKRSLSRMLKKMKLFQGYRPDRLFLEAFPERNGGCVLYVSGLSEEAVRENSGEAVLMCRTDSLDSLVRLCRGVEACGFCIKSCVYHGRGGYLLAVTAESGEYFLLYRLFSEFGRVCTDASEISAVSEYTVPVCEKDACRIFSGLY